MFNRLIFNKIKEPALYIGSDRKIVIKIRQILIRTIFKWNAYTYGGFIHANIKHRCFVAYSGIRDPIGVVFSFMPIMFGEKCVNQ